MNESESLTYYYGVVYFKNGEVSISAPFDSKEKCIEAIKEGLVRHLDKVAATSYITRSKKYSTQQMFGCPKSRDLIRDKRFMASL